MSDIYVKRNFQVGLQTQATATLPTDVPSLSQVEGILSGYTYAYDSVRVEAASNIDLVTGGLLTIDGITVADGDRILVAGQTTASENGIYVASTGAWSRSSDMPAAAEVKAYSHVYVREGNTHGGHEMVLQSVNASETVGTDALVWVHGYTLDNEAAHIDVNDTGFTYISGGDVQTALASADTNFGIVVNHTDALTGVTADNLGTFTGDTITDNTTIKSALQELETAVENISTDAASITYDATGNTFVLGATAQAALDNIDTALINSDTRIDTLLGVAGSDLGTFTGTTIADSADVKTALQSLETAVEAIDASGAASTVYAAQRYEQTSTTFTGNAWTTITHNLNEAHPSSIAVYGAGGDLMTYAFNIEVLDANSLRIENEYPVDLTGMSVVVRA